MSDTFDLILAPYPGADAAQSDFDDLVAAVKGGSIRSQGVILVERTSDGQVRVTHTADQLGRKGARWGGGVGVLVGLFSPPLLASVVVGGAVGGLVGKFTKKKVDSGLEEGMADKLPPGGAMIIAIVDDDHRLEAERALDGTPARSLVTMDGGGLSELKASLDEAAGKFSPDRSALPIPDRAFGGTAGRTLADSVPDWAMIPGPEAPDGAPNVLVVLIDDAGFGAIETYGGPVAEPQLHAGPGDGHHLQQLPRDRGVLPDPGRAAHGAEPAPGGVRIDRRVSRAVPGLHRGQAQVLCRLPSHPEGERLRHQRVRQVAPHS